MKKFFYNQKMIMKYRKDVIANNLSIFNDESLTDIEFVENLGVTQLLIKWCSGIMINNVPQNMAELTISNCALQSIDNIGDLAQLQLLDLSKNNILRVEVLTKLNKLKTLVLNDNININLQQVGQLVQLRELSLDSIGFSEIQFLDKLTNLQFLSMNQNKITNISSISQLKQLEKLYLSENQISEISSLKTLKKLTTLILNKNIIYNFDLYNLTSLISLELNDNFLTNLHPISSLKNLQVLLLDNNNITEIYPLRNLTSLYKLNLKNNRITDLYCLKNLIHLRSLCLNKNRVINIQPLLQLNFDFLYLQHNYIQQFYKLQVENIFQDDQENAPAELKLLNSKIEAIHDVSLLQNKQCQMNNKQLFQQQIAKIGIYLQGVQNTMIQLSSIFAMSFQEEIPSQ
ncbi:leucine-rich_repeat domain-containing protein [Hexamita inflata]|uniref:Leucine-rich repeat domain-containing protein n=1 Tax=Hexamita inflata TaxID=28002 RepID=A0AA86NE05_9EUKA|nr:leucine-rich repeat domain-containing protein [Hexamita inflata]